MRKEAIDFAFELIDHTQNRKQKGISDGEYIEDLESTADYAKMLCGCLVELSETALLEAKKLDASLRARTILPSDWQ